ncbi:MAG: hypothetical protein V1709_08965 [Planctomycetota bacterium]
MNIKCEHHLIDNDNTEEKRINKENEGLIRKISKIIQIKNNRKVLFYFHRLTLFQNKSTKVVSAYAKVYPASYQCDIPEFLRNKIQEKKCDYLVYISKYVRISGDEIYKICYFAHEFQHIKQYECDKKIWSLGCIFLYSFHCKLIPDFKYDFQLPMEYDAERFAKKIMIEIAGQTEIQNWLNRKICESKDGSKKALLCNLSKININDSYDVLDESKRLWERYETTIRTYNKNNPNETNLANALEKFDTMNS